MAPLGDKMVGTLPADNNRTAGYNCTVNQVDTPSP